MGKAALVTKEALFPKCKTIYKDTVNLEGIKNSIITNERGSLWKDFLWNEQRKGFDFWAATPKYKPSQLTKQQLDELWLIYREFSK